MSGGTSRGISVPKKPRRTELCQEASASWSFDSSQTKARTTSQEKQQAAGRTHIHGSHFTLPAIGPWTHSLPCPHPPLPVSLITISFNKVLAQPGFQDMCIPFYPVFFWGGGGKPPRNKMIQTLTSRGRRASRRSGVALSVSSFPLLLARVYWRP